MKPEEIVNDDKLRNSYEMYLNIDITKNVQQSTMVTTLIKPKKKKEENNTNTINNNNQVQVKPEVIKTEL